MSFSSPSGFESFGWRTARLTDLPDEAVVMMDLLSLGDHTVRRKSSFERDTPWFWILVDPRCLRDFDYHMSTSGCGCYRWSDYHPDDQGVYVRGEYRWRAI